MTIPVVGLSGSCPRSMRVAKPNIFPNRSAGLCCRSHTPIGSNGFSHRVIDSYTGRRPVIISSIWLIICVYNKKSPFGNFGLGVADGGRTHYPLAGLSLDAVKIVMLVLDGDIDLAGSA